MEKKEETNGLIEDLRTTEGATLSREGCLTLANLIEEQQKEIERLESFIENLQVVHFVEVQREKAQVERYEKALKEIERWDRMLYSNRELGNFAKRALGLPTVPLKD